MAACPSCGTEALEIDLKCSSCGTPLGATGAHRMLGKVMLGQYELIDVLGQGGMSVVFKGKHKLTDQEVALKILPPELAAHSQVKSRFLEEAKALAALDHPNIVHLYNFGQEDGFFVLAMQYVQGQTWERMIMEAQRLDWPASCRMAVDVLRALEYAHGRGIVHRDMKPSNVLVRAHDNAATVMDFGIAKMTTSTRLTQEGQTMGTVRYMSPEQVRGQEVDLRTDLYSLGATLYESLVGDTPFGGETHFEIMTKHLSEVPKRPSTLGITLPLAVEDALMRALAKKPGDRWESARDMRKVLETALREADVGLGETQPISAAVVSTLRDKLPRTPMPHKPGVAAPTALSDALEPDNAAPRRKRSIAPWLALGVLLVAGGTAAALVLLKKRPSSAPAATSTKIEGVTLTAMKTFGSLTIETDGSVTPEEVEAAYRAALVELRKQAAKPAEDPVEPPAPDKGPKPKGPKAPAKDKPSEAKSPKSAIELRDPVITVIVAMPQLALCSPAAYPMGVAPLDCRTTLATVAIGGLGVQRMMVASERTSLARALLIGTAKALCDFPADQSDPRLREICDMQKQFDESH